MLRTRYLYADQASGSWFLFLFCFVWICFFLGGGEGEVGSSFFHWSLDLMSCRILPVTKGFGRPRIVTVIIGTCSSITLLNNKVILFSLSSGSFVKNRPGCLQNIRVKVVGLVIFEASNMQSI